MKQLPWGPVLGAPGALCVHPGNSEWVPEQAAPAGFKWLALNVIDWPADSWDLVRGRCRALGITVYPWGRFHTDDSQATISNTALAWKTRPMYNIEDEAKAPGYPGSKSWGQPKLVAARVKKFWPKIQPILSIPGWPYWGGTDWTPLSYFPVLLQILWTDMHLPPDRERIAQVQRDCEWKAQQVFRRVGVSYQTFHDSPAALYDRNRKGWSLIWGETTNSFPTWSRPV